MTRPIHSAGTSCVVRPQRALPSRYRVPGGKEEGARPSGHSALSHRREGAALVPPTREHGVWITWPLWGTEIEDKAASRLLSGLAVPQGEVVHGEHAGLVFRGQELPARREIWFLPSYLGTRLSPFLPYTVVLAGPREQLPSVLVDLQVEHMSS